MVRTSGLVFICLEGGKTSVAISRGSKHHKIKFDTQKIPKFLLVIYKKNIYKLIWIIETA